MSKVALFQPTYRPGGIDVFEASISRQNVKPDVIYVADELHRAQLWKRTSVYLDIDIQVISAPWNPSYKRNLVSAYNEAAQLSLQSDCDLFISLQDYIWIPENGIEKFVELHENNPNDLITGVTHISSDPSPNEIQYINNSYTIFKTPYWHKPKDIAWHDVRAEEIYAAKGVFEISPDHWEANWAAVPVTMFEKGIKWDEDFDKGIAYENIDFARTCQNETGCRVLIDTYNAAISLPHKEYWPEEKQEIIDHSNRWFLESKWGV